MIINNDLALNTLIYDMAEPYMQQVLSALHIDTDKDYYLLLTGISRKVYSKKYMLDGYEYNSFFNEFIRPDIEAIIENANCVGACSIMYDSDKRILVVIQPQSKKTSADEIAMNINCTVERHFREHYKLNEVNNTTYLSEPLKGMYGAFSNWSTVDEGYNTCFFRPDIGFVTSERLKRLKSDLSFIQINSLVSQFSEYLRTGSEMTISFFQTLCTKLRDTFSQKDVSYATSLLESSLISEYEIYEIEEEFISLNSSMLFSRYYSFSEWCESYEKLLQNILNKISSTRTYSAITTMAMLYMTNNIGKDFSVSDITEVIGINENYLSRVFSDDYGKSINRFHLELRIKNAKKMLESTNLSITDIATAIGYNDRRYFSRVFRAQCGMSPRQYRYTFLKK